MIPRRNSAFNGLAVRAAIAVLTAVLVVALPAEIGMTQSKGKYTNKTIRKKEKELNNLKAEIRKYEKKLAESKSIERNTLDRIDDISRQTGLIRKFIGKLNDRINDYQREIEIAQDGLEAAEVQLKTLQAAYAKYIVNVYKQGRTHDTELLLSSASINQMLIRSHYLKVLTRTHRVEAEEIRQAQRAIEIQKQLLEARLQKQLEAREEKQKEQNRLKKRESEHKNLLQRARNDKSTYARHLKRKQAAARKVERLVADLIAKERAKAAAKRGAKGALADLPTTPISQTAFGKLRGRLPWPVSRGSVVQGFGEYVNPETSVRHISPGIDIRVPEGTPVRAVADGTVDLITFLVGYGTLVMINHGEEFITVYAHLKSVSVKEGQKVKAGQRIASSREGVSGPEVHFELWHVKDKQNPLTWLSPQ